MNEQTWDTGNEVSGHSDILKRQIASARVVIFCSSLTDVRPVTAHLERQDVRFRLVTMGMGSLRMRERFHALQACTGWQMLPQIFVDGRFIGGHQEILGLDLGASRRIPSPALWLGAGGLIPFVAAALALWLAPDSWHGEIFGALLVYGAVILSFTGAVHWGLAMCSPGGESGLWPRLGLSVLPALIGWAALLADPAMALGVLMLVFSATYLVESAVPNDAPSWYGRLRAWLSAGVVLSLLAAWMGTSTGAQHRSHETILEGYYEQGAVGERGTGPALAEPIRAPYRPIIF